MPDNEEILSTLPHSSFGDPECCGVLYGIRREGDYLASVVCNECNAILQTVAAGDLRRTLDEMELTLDVAAAKCPHCGAVNLLSGFSKVLVFTCRECGDVVRLD